MKLSHRWLTRHLPDVPEPYVIESILIQMGIEVSAKESWGQDFAAVELVRVVARVAHPNADHLSVVTVEGRAGTMTDVVTGASNGMVGEYVWYAPPGTQLPDGRILDTVNMRGIPSPGMLLSASELGFQEAGGDLWVYRGDRPVGTTFLEAIGGVDTLYELELTPNLAVFDQSVLGIAREVAAVLGLQFRDPSREFRYGTDGNLVGIVDPMGCPVYGLTELRLEGDGTTPLWMQVLLRSIGIRLIHPVVDITNFVLWDIGQPLHAFDADAVVLPIEVRRATDGENMTLLDGSLCTLTPEDLVIADQKGPIALAGIMGGDRASVRPTTRHVFLESAYFSAAGIFKSARRHRIVSDAAQHYGKGADPSMVVVAADATLGLLREVSGLATRLERSTLQGKVPNRREIAFEPERIRQILGVSWSDQQIQEGLGRLRFEVRDRSVVIPWDRHDVMATEDLSEEVARLRGFDQIGATLPSTPTRPGSRDSEVSFHENLRDKWAALGYWEVVTRPFWDRSRDVLGLGFEGTPVVVTNPLREEESELRRDLLPNVLEVLAYNRGRREQPVSIFELAPVYHQRNGLPVEPMALAVAEVLEVAMQYPPAADVGIFRLKGALEWVNRQLNLGLHEDPSGPIPDFMHPGRSVALYNASDVLVGYLGEIRPRLASLKFHAKRIGVLSLSPIVPSAPARGGVILAPSRYPDVSRDLSLMGPNLSYQAIIKTVSQSGALHLQKMRLIDVFAGDFGKSVTIRLIFQSMTRTLTDVEVDQEVRQVVDALKQQGVSLRGQ